MEETLLKEKIASLAKEKGNKEALAQFLVEYIDPTHIATDFVSMFFNARSMKEGDVMVKKLRSGMTVRTLVPGSIHLKQEVTVEERANYALDGAIISVGCNLWDLENGEIGTVEDLRREATLTLRDFYQNKVFTALSTVWNAVNTPSNYTSVGGAVNATVLKAAIDYLNQNVGPVKAVVGARSALNPITTFGGFWADPNSTLHKVDPLLNEIAMNGWLGRWYGTPIVALDQQFNNPKDHTALIPTDKIMVIAENVGDFITYGEAKSTEWTDPRPVPPYWTMNLYQRFSLMVWKAEGIFVLGNLS